MSFQLTRGTSLQLADLAQMAYPTECAGILVGRGRCIEGLVPAPNGAEWGFALDPSTLAGVFKRAHLRDREVLGVYHSHPGGTHRPSSRDGQELPPFCLCLIVTADSEQSPRIGGYIRESMDQPLKEIALQVVLEASRGGAA